jgi:phosphoribosyl-ATP pyrophosphohydrolase
MPKPKVKQTIKATAAALKPAKPLKPKRAARLAAPAEPQTGHVLDRLFDVIVSRRGADPALSHSARLLRRGRAKVAQKFGEEAVEAVIEGVAGERAALVAESADVLYHLLLLWVACDLPAQDVWAELARREGVSGIIEKSSRPLPRDLLTRKIP